MPDAVGKVTQEFVERAVRAIRWVEERRKNAPDLPELEVPPFEVRVKIDTHVDPDPPITANPDGMWPAKFILKSPEPPFTEVELDACWVYDLNGASLVEGRRYKGYTVGYYAPDDLAIVEITDTGEGNACEIDEDQEFVTGAELSGADLEECNFGNLVFHTKKHNCDGTMTDGEDVSIALGTMFPTTTVEVVTDVEVTGECTGEDITLTVTLTTQNVRVLNCGT